ncbi:late embryogenesis abundant protein D-34-like isoform X1 [Lotus japonicus]|uniref:late embryogenesis abundant protein D-34-like isoform X1 n=1 Tax=Lotus japonicus TaxID=34305 RepID=UPI00258C809B|nr:late embryogenesis abundant protein D-34-like isoform X1 [Lotus japonicus]
MSQEQPQRPQHEEAVKYGDVFNVEGDLKSKPVAPVDAALMQKAENAMLGKTQKGGAAAAMQSAAAKNEREGVVGHNDMSKIATEGGVSLTETDVSGRQVITESVGGQVLHNLEDSVTKKNLEDKGRKFCKLAEVVEQFNQKASLNTVTPPSLVQEMGAAGAGGTGGITIGEALEATVLTAGKKPVEWSDAAAIQAAEVRATGRTNIVPGGVAAAAQSAATLNARATKDEEKTKLADILTDATSKLPADRVATRRDAEGVTGAEMRNDPNLTTHPGGVSASVAAAARLNQQANHN